ncbi:hypothetical protein PWG14_28965 [Chromobacterium amazonense]|uniref:hypothetical protein n=1 Tax=Chromobacterium amazonense TaxID=1382803 RepID=UPI00237D5B4F|nr:hypothetical protein [Chromobacterium amazonense]MDE1716502.1 hypothetical protein [Chromobacterium amazonense]
MDTTIEKGYLSDKPGFHGELNAVAQKFKLKIVKNGQTIGYLMMEQSGIYNHYAKIGEKGDDFQIQSDGTGDVIAIQSGISKGYFLSVEPRGWVCSARLDLSPYWTVDNKSSSTFQLKTKGKDVVQLPISADKIKKGEWTYVWPGKGEAIEFQKEPV